MVISESCRSIINRDRINECCEPHLEGIPLKQQVRYMQGSCDYLVNVIIKLLYVIRELETSQAPSGGPGA